jgi:hypothetical protein
MTTEPSKEELFQQMPHVWMRNDDGSTMEWRCHNHVWTWKHVAPDGTVLAEGEGAP